MFTLGDDQDHHHHDCNSFKLVLIFWETRKACEWGHKHVYHIQFQFDFNKVSIKFWSKKEKKTTKNEKEEEESHDNIV